MPEHEQFERWERDCHHAQTHAPVRPLFRCSELTPFIDALVPVAACLLVRMRGRRRGSIDNAGQNSTIFLPSPPPPPPHHPDASSSPIGVFMEHDRERKIGFLQQAVPAEFAKKRQKSAKRSMHGKRKT